MFLGIDLGTSATKAVLIDDRAAVRAVASAPHPIAHPRPAWSEQHPEDWDRSAAEAVRAALAAPGVDPAQVRAVGLSGQMHGSVCLDHADRVVRPALLWNDQRTGEQCRAIEHRAGGRRALIARVGNAALPGFTLPKLLWIREHEPRHWASVRRVMLPKDFLALRLTGEHATDVGDASGTLLFDVEHRRWRADAFEQAELDPALFPTAHESGTAIGALRAQAAATLGLPPGIPVAIGSGDNQTGAIGAGVVHPGLALITLGTSGVVYAHADRPRYDLPDDPAVPPGRLHTMCAADGRAHEPGHWSMTGCTLAAGGALAWARALLAPQTDYAHLVRDALTQSPPGARGLAFLPHLTGERCPYPDPDARGAWVGLTARHTRDDLVRAVIEGVTFSLAEIIELMRQAGVAPSRARLGGGGAASHHWRQLLADACRLPVCVPTTTEGPAFGAALLAGVAAGAWSSVAEAAESATEERDHHEPHAPTTDALDAARAAWASLYAALRPAHQALHALDA